MADILPATWDPSEILQPLLISARARSGAGLCQSIGRYAQSSCLTFSSRASLLAMLLSSSAITRV